MRRTRLHFGVYVKISEESVFECLEMVHVGFKSCKIIVNGILHWKGEKITGQISEHCFENNRIY